MSDSVQLAQIRLAQWFCNHCNRMITGPVRDPRQADKARRHDCGFMALPMGVWSE